MMRDVVQDKRREGSAVAAARAACRSRAGLEWLGAAQGTRWSARRTCPSWL